VGGDHTARFGARRATSVSKTRQFPGRGKRLAGRSRSGKSKPRFIRLEFQTALKKRGNEPGDRNKDSRSGEKLRGSSLCCQSNCRTGTLF
jgi:hypothetical protein